MKVERFVTGIISTNCYLAVNEETKQAVIVDPAACPKKMLDYIEEQELKIEAILLTHGHFDHIMGIDGFCLIFIPVLLFLCKLHIMKKVNVRENVQAGIIYDRNMQKG